MRGGFGFFLQPDIVPPVVQELMRRIAALRHFEDEIIALFAPYLLYPYSLGPGDNIGTYQTKYPVLIAETRGYQPALADAALHPSGLLQFSLFRTAYYDQPALGIQKSTYLLEDAVDLDLPAFELQHGRFFPGG